MAHVVEAAASGRSKCRGCGEPIAKGELRFGERLPNPFADGEMTQWYHTLCGAYRRPEAFEEILQQPDHNLESVDVLAAAVAGGLAHQRVVRIGGVERAPSGRARCRCCRELIEKEAWRIPLLFFEEGAFNASGFIHVTCSGQYFETVEIIDRLEHFGKGLAAAEIDELRRLLG
ncbi:MAG: PARP-type zinc finger-containing protein [Gammaproteobacteria bacterium]|nr:PARP-type zinc finger-containing protein [Gammaproteobacteria bacterium]